MGFSCVNENMCHYLDKQSLYYLFPLPTDYRSLSDIIKGAFILLQHIALVYIIVKIAANKTSC